MCRRNIILNRQRQYMQPSLVYASSRSVTLLHASVSLLHCKWLDSCHECTVNRKTTRVMHARVVVDRLTLQTNTRWVFQPLDLGEHFRCLEAKRIGVQPRGGTLWWNIKGPALPTRCIALERLFSSSSIVSYAYELAATMLFLPLAILVGIVTASTVPRENEALGLSTNPNLSLLPNASLVDDFAQ
jgi:hypothetical protein